jgi:hypothetical protein
MSRFFQIVSSVILLGLVTSSDIWGQAAPSTSESEDAKALNLLYGDFDSPDLTAPTLLGLAANQVTKPANIKAFATNLVGAGASFPQVGTGLGLEIAPIQFFRRSAWNGEPTLAASLKEYSLAQNRFSRGFTLSAAQASTASEARVAVGGALVLLDRTDPLLDVAYVDTVAARLRRQKERTQLFQQIDFNDAVAQNRLLVFVNKTDIYPNNQGYYTGPAADKLKAQQRLKSLDALLNNIGLLPQVTPAMPLATIEDFTKQQAALITTLRSTVAGSLLFTQPQVTAIIGEAERLKTAVVAVYANYATVVQQVYTATNTVVKEAKEHFEQQRWNATIIQVGGGATWVSADKKYATARPQAGSYFARAALRPYFMPTSKADRQAFDPEKLTGFKRTLYWHTQLIADVRYNNYRATGVTTPTSTKVAADSLDHRWWYGARLIVGGAYLRLSGEFAVQKLSYRQAAEDASALAGRQLADTYYSSTIGAEIRLVEKVWLEFAIGSTKPAGQAAQLLTLGSLKYAIRNSQRFKTN